MSDADMPLSQTISPQLAALRCEQGMALTALFSETWLSNPQLAKQAGRRIQEFVMPLSAVQQLHLNDLT